MRTCHTSNATKFSFREKNWQHSYDPSLVYAYVDFKVVFNIWSSKRERERILENILRVRSYGFQSQCDQFPIKTKIFDWWRKTNLYVFQLNDNWRVYTAYTETNKKCFAILRVLCHLNTNPVRSTSSNTPPRLCWIHSNFIVRICKIILSYVYFFSFRYQKIAKYFEKF